MKQVLFAPILFFVCFLFFIYFFLPGYSDFNGLKKDISDIKINVQQKQTYFSELRETSTKLTEKKESLEKIRAALPEKLSLASLLNFFQKKALENGLILKSFNQSQVSLQSKKEKKEEESSDAGIKETEITITLQGHFSSLKNFLQAIEKSSKVIEVEKINLANSEEGFLKSNLLLKVYSY